MHFTKRGRI